MPGPLYLVDLVEAFNELPDRYELQMQSGADALFLAKDDPNALSRLEILRRRQQRQRKTYIHFDPTSRMVEWLSMPYRTPIGKLQEFADGVEVDLLFSHAHHVLHTSHPTFIDTRRLLAKAQSEKLVVLASVDPNGRILDARYDATLDDLSDWWTPGIHKAPLRPAAPQSISQAKADELFTLLWSQNCNASSPTSSCNPYRYVAQGCQARASDMVRFLIAEESITPTKIWAYKGSKNFTVKTANDPDCSVVWTWHVAPRIRVTVGSVEEWRIFDPSLFDQQVSETDWLDALSSSGDYTTAITEDPAIYIRWSAGTTVMDPHYIQTDADLEDLRDSLQEMANQDGAPPYAKCSATTPAKAPVGPFEMIWTKLTRFFGG